MLPLWFLVFLTLKSCQVLADDSLKSTSKFVCTVDLSCSEESQSRFFETELLVKILERQNFSNDQSQYYEQKKLSLCNDITYAGFLLSNATADWPVSCLWTCLKNRSCYANCALAPSSYDIKDYIPPKKWSKMLMEFRTRINCSKDQIEAAKKVKELNICRDRCVNVGMNGLSLWILIFSLILSTLLLIGRDGWFGWFFYVASFTTLCHIFIYFIWKPFGK